MAFPPDNFDAALTVARVHIEMKKKGVKCGECNLCCTVMRVEMAPVANTFKPAHVKCSKACKAGCSIYENKPYSCDSFICLWIMMSLLKDDFPMKWRPDKIGAVIDMNDVGNLTVHLKHNNAWRMEGELRECLFYLLEMVPFLILDRPSEPPILLRPGGYTEDLIEITASASGFKRFRTKTPEELLADQSSNK